MPIKAIVILPCIEEDQYSLPVVFSRFGFPHKSLCQVCVCFSFFYVCLILLSICFVIE